LEENELPKNSRENVECFIPPRKKMVGANRLHMIDQPEAPNTAEPPVPTILSEIKYDQLLNGVLPQSIRILGWCPVTPDFSARFSASSRTYRYFFIRRDLDLTLMQKGLDKMLGRHDFRNLCKMNCDEVDNFERVVLEAKIVACDPTSNDDVGQSYNASGSKSTDAADCSVDKKTSGDSFFRQSCYIQITGQAFLWHQIRCIVSVLFMIGKGLESPNVVDELLDVCTNPGKPAYPFAPDLPLVLHSCGYKNLTFGRSVQNLWSVCCDLESKWEDLALASDRIRNGIETLKAEAWVQKSDVLGFIKNILEERRKKSAKYSNREDVRRGADNSMLDIGDENAVITWGEALGIIERFGRTKPSPESHKVLLHIPLMQRSRGTTLEEKVNSILASPSQTMTKRRRERYQENVGKKKKSTEEDDKFYKYKLCQGGSGL